MTPEYIPPPQYTVLPQHDVPAHYVNAPPRTDSPYEYDKSSFDTDGPVPTITYSPQGEASPLDRGQKTQDLNNCVEDIGNEAAEAKRAKDSGEETENLCNTLGGSVCADHTDPPSNENFNKPSDSTLSNDGGYDNSGYSY